MSDYRITFSKKGSLAFISHLDFNHSFIRILKRAGLPLKYSQGFNPRPKIVFGLPLSVGMEGENELVDVSLTEELSCSEVKERLAKAVPEEICIKDVSYPEIKMKNIEYAVYDVVFYDFHADTAKVVEVLKNPPPVSKHTKSGEKLTDIAPMIKSWSVQIAGGDTLLTLTLTAYDSMYLKPDYVVDSLNSAGLCLPDNYSVTRTGIIFKEI